MSVIRDGCCLSVASCTALECILNYSLVVNFMSVINYELIHLCNDFQLMIHTQKTEHKDNFVI